MSFGQIGVDVNVQVEVKDLKQILETLDRFRAMAGDNGDLAKRIDQLKKDMSDLIDQAERAGGHLNRKSFWILLSTRGHLQRLVSS